MNTPRYNAVKTATSRSPRQFEPLTDETGSPYSVEEYFGYRCFTRNDMAERLPESTMLRFDECMDTGKTLDRDLADHVAHTVYQWAMEQGATHFCHWFQPLTGTTAEKHDGFIQMGGDTPIFSFSGSELIQSEPDASSFPNGGSRTTFEARGYTLWDPSSPIFLMERENGSTLCIPSTFVSYFGNVLDSKTPLKRSMESLGERAVTLCHKLGETDVTKIIATAGPEQEYFLIDKAYASLRPDILLTGRSILGAPAPKGQSLDDHYFGSIPSRVAAFMHEVEQELYGLGVPVKTRHNEVAPCQFEVAVVYAEANIAADHNQLVMEMLERVADRHDFHCSLHEKPFKGVNGSGKHLNWSMADNLGRNLLDPTKTPSTNLRFLSFLTAILLGVHKNAGLLRASIGSYSNDFRLGANEAPPAIISAFLGTQLSKICDDLAAGKDLGQDSGKSMVNLGVESLPELKQDTTDRNRTSPFAFTGNKFEFRAAGSTASVSFPLTCVNAAIADGIDMLLRLIDEKGDVLEAIREGIRQSNPIRFEGDNYSDAWVEEAEKRGLPHYRKTPHALRVLAEEQTVSLFERLNILSKLELNSQYHVKVEQYVTHVTIEADILQQLVKQFVLPAALAERTAACADVAAQRGVFEADDVDSTHATDIHSLIQQLRSEMNTLTDALANNGSITNEQEQAEGLALIVAPQMERVRAVCDEIEMIVSDSRWPLPKYREMLFQN